MSLADQMLGWEKREREREYSGGGGSGSCRGLSARVDQHEDVVGIYSQFFYILFQTKTKKN